MGGLETHPLHLSSPVLGPLEGENATTVAVSTTFTLEPHDLSVQVINKGVRTASIFEDDTGLRDVRGGGFVVKSMVTS